MDILKRKRTLSLKELTHADVILCLNVCRKYVEVLYKCKPVSFRSRVVCGGEEVSLSCQNQSSRLAIFSATFSTTSGGHVFCPARRHVARDFRLEPETVLSCDHSVTDTVSDFCHGYSDCKFSANPASLGGVRQCIGAEHLTLKVTFACVDKSVFHSKYVDRITTTTPATTTTTSTTLSPSISSNYQQSPTVPPKSVIKSDIPKSNSELKSQESKVNLGSEIVIVERDNEATDIQNDLPAMLETNSNFEEVSQR